MGKPLIGYPQFGDQMGVCRRIADAGAGITGPQGGWVQAEDVHHVLSPASLCRSGHGPCLAFWRSSEVHLGLLICLSWQLQVT